MIVMANTQEDEKLWKNVKQALQNFLHTESFNKIQKANKWLAEQLQNATQKNIYIGERPKFQRFDFTGKVSGEIGSCKTGKPFRVFYQPFSDYCWLMVNEDESNFNCCLNNNARYVKKILGANEFEGIYSIKEEKEVALSAATHDAICEQLGGSLNLYIDNVKVQTYSKSEVGKEKEIPIRPVYVITPGGSKIFIGTFFEENNKIEITIYDAYSKYDKRTNSIRWQLDYVNKLFKKNSKKVAKIFCISIVVLAVLGVISYLIYLLT